MSKRQYVPSSLGESTEFRDQAAFDEVRAEDARAQKANKRQEAANKKISMYAIYFCPAETRCGDACADADGGVHQ